MLLNVQASVIYLFFQSDMLPRVLVVSVLYDAVCSYCDDMRGLCHINAFSSCCQNICNALF